MRYAGGMMGLVGRVYSALGACREPPDAGLMCECLWSDPAPEKGRQVSWMQMLD
jgi:hypothetical protein